MALKEAGTYYQRKCHIESAVECLDSERTESFQATIFNISDRDLFIETGHKFKPGEHVCIHLSQLVPKELTNDLQLNESKGSIRLSKIEKDGDRPHYRAQVSLSK